MAAVLCSSVFLSFFMDRFVLKKLLPDVHQRKGREAARLSRKNETTVRCLRKPKGNYQRGKSSALERVIQTGGDCVDKSRKIGALQVWNIYKIDIILIEISRIFIALPASSLPCWANFLVNKQTHFWGLYVCKKVKKEIVLLHPLRKKIELEVEGRAT